MSRLPDIVDRWLTVDRPVTYWSFWGALLRLAPVFLVVFVFIAIRTNMRFTVYSFAPIPFVFVAATVGYAVRDLNPIGGVTSLLIAGCYGFLLWLSGTGTLLLHRPTPMLSVIAVLAFLAMVTGFASPTLHGRRRNQEFSQAYRKHKSNDDE